MVDTPSWWYVISEKKSLVFLIIVNILDIFMMPVLFFISGYFTPASYIRNGTIGFLKNKTRHIALPWLLGIIILIPLLPLCMGKSVDYVINLIKTDPSYLFYPQAHLWYLGILFIFLVCYAMIAHFTPPSKKRSSVSDRKHIFSIIVLITLSAVCASFSDHYITSFDNWISLAYVFTLKPAKIVTYICIFILGTYAWRTNWFTKEGWMPSLRIWRILAISTIACTLILKLSIIPNYNLHTLNNLIPALDCICSFTTLIYALLIGLKLQKSNLSEFMAKMSPYSYAIYWIHMPIVFLYLYLINDLDFPIILKWASGIIVTTLISFVISKYVLKKAVFLRDIF